MTITDHPLDDLHPLAFQGVNPLMENLRPAIPILPVNLIQTQMEIVHVGYKIPLIVLYNP